MPPSNAPPWGYLVHDVLQEIFIFSVTGVNKYFDCLVLDSRRPSFRYLPQLSISHVCSTWRQVSLLTPRLWNTIYIKDITHFNTLIAKDWLSRARDVPVSIKVETRTRDEEDTRYSLLISLLSPHRIQHLEVQSTMHITLSDLSARSVADIETLAMHNDGFYRGCIELNNERYRKLTHLWLAGNYFVFGACDSLRKFDASQNFLTVGEFWSFLGGCPLLEECYVLIKCDYGGRLPLATNVYLPSLRILQLAFPSRYYENPFTSIIESFALPRLETFIVESSAHWSTPAFGILSRRSEGLPHLKTFTLRTSEVIVEAGPLLALIPSVTRVSLCYSGFSDDEVSDGEAIFDDDTLNRLASGLLGPRLKELVVGYISNSHHFMDMVESRMENAQKCNDGTTSASFTRVEFKSRERYEDISDRLNNMQQRGIPIHMLDNDNL